MFAQPIFAKYALMLAKAETTYGTDPTPILAGNSVLATDVTIKSPGENAVHDGTGPFADPLFAVPGMTNFDIEFKLPLCGNGKDGTSAVRTPAMNPILEACNVVAATSGGPPVTTVTWTPKTQQGKSATIYVWLFGVASGANKYVLSGFVGSVKLVAKPEDAYAYFLVTGKAIYTIPTYEAAPTRTPVFYELAAPSIVGRTCTLGSSALHIRSLEFEFESDITGSPSIGPASSAGFARFTAIRKPSRLKLLVDAVLEDGTAGKALYAARDGATTLAFALSSVGAGSDGNTWALTIGDCRIVSLDEGEADGLLTYALDLVALGTTTGDDAWSMTLT